MQISTLAAVVLNKNIKRKDVLDDKSISEKIRRKYRQRDRRTNILSIVSMYRKLKFSFLRRRTGNDTVVSNHSGKNIGPFPPFFFHRRNVFPLVVNKLAIGSNRFLYYFFHVKCN